MTSGTAQPELPIGPPLLKRRPARVTVVQTALEPESDRVARHRPASRRRPVAATFLIDGDHLRAEMAARGITGRDLAREAGISEGTIYHALNCRPILVRNAKLIAGALERIPIEPALGRLVLRPAVGPPGT